MVGIEAAETKEIGPTLLGHSKFNTLVKSPCFRVRGLGSLTCKIGLSATAGISGTFTTSYLTHL